MGSDRPFWCLAPFFFALAFPAGADPTPEPATPAPLAGSVLLLDAATVGDGVVAVGSYGHILRIHGLGWVQSPSPVRFQLTAVDFVDDQIGWAVGHDAAIIRTDDAGASWRLQHFAPELEQPLFDVLFADPDTGFAVGAYGLMLRTDDGGESWEEVEYADYPDSHLNALALLADGTLLVLGERGIAYRSVDTGESWEQLEFPYEGSTFGAVVAADGVRVVTFGLRGRVFTSDDAGDTWTRVPTGTELSLMGGTVTADGRIVLVGMNGLVLVSSDGGESFERFRHPDGDALAAVFEVPGYALAVAGESGLAPLDFNTATAQ
ncbi:MAG: hypothetical protein LC632_04535 [Xanthomonadaceae bacterium]|nr:hypothetical protein [Xanthomonadaceae bacterium]